MHLFVLAVLTAVAVVAVGLLAVLVVIVAGIHADDRQISRGARPANRCQTLAHRLLGVAGPVGSGHSHAESRNTRSGGQ
jgi:hypothetical protein